MTMRPYLARNFDVDEEEAVRLDSAQGARVLVVDDDDSMRELVRSSLAVEGFEVNEAASAMNLAFDPTTVFANGWLSDEVDLVIVDLRMPGMNGLELISKLRDARCPTPAILMTAFPDAETLAEAERLGVQVLSKPFALEVLTRTALSLLVPLGNEGCARS